MPTITTGVFFVGKQPPQWSVEGDQFVLTLRVVDNQGPGRVEPYMVRWVGEAARTWWSEHQGLMTAGRPLHLQLVNPRSFPGLRAPETHATVAQCSLAPLAPSWQGQNTQRAQEAQHP